MVVAGSRQCREKRRKENVDINCTFGLGLITLFIGQLVTIILFCIRCTIVSSSSIPLRAYYMLLESEKLGESMINDG